jgi:hypothetical protein
MLNEKEIMDMKEVLRSESMEELDKRIKSLQSMKCRLKKIESKKDEMEEVLIKERIVREVIIEKKEIKVVIYERSIEDIGSMNYEEVMKGIKNIDSILCIENSKDKEFKNMDKIGKCIKVREWLISRKKVVSGSELGKVNISDIYRKLEDIKDIDELKKWLIEKSGLTEENLIEE